MASKTQEPCDCGVSSWMLNDPESGFILDDKNQFQINGYMAYHCTFCGGCLPDSSKPIWYPRLTAEEHERLKQLINGIQTPEQALERLGPPDYNEVMQYYEALDGGMPVVGAEINLDDDPRFVLNKEKSNTRNVEYYHLSSHADIHFYFSPDGVHTEIRVKVISPHHMTTE